MWTSNTANPITSNTSTNVNAIITVFNYGHVTISQREEIKKYLKITIIIIQLHKCTNYPLCTRYSSWWFVLLMDTRGGKTTTKGLTTMTTRPAIVARLCWQVCRCDPSQVSDLVTPVTTSVSTIPREKWFKRTKRVVQVILQPLWCDLFLCNRIFRMKKSGITN